MHHLMSEKFAEILAWSNGVEWRMKAVLTGSKSNVFALLLLLPFNLLRIYKLMHQLIYMNHLPARFC